MSKFASRYKVIAAAAGVTLVTVFGAKAHAAPFYWDVDATSGLTPGAGTWTTTAGNPYWQNNNATPGVTPPVQWVDVNSGSANSANFQTGGVNTVTVSGSVNVAGIAQTVAGTATTISGGTIRYWGGNVSNDQTATDLVINSDLSLQNGLNVTAIAGASSIFFNGVISGSNGIQTSGAGGGSRAVFTNANTYTGATTITRGIFEYRSLANGGTASGLGQSSSAASNLILNSGSNPGIFRFNSTGATATSTDRLFTLSGAGNTATITNESASPLATLEFSNTGSIALLTNGSHGLTLGGSNTGVNTFRPKLTDSGLLTASLLKSGGGTWRVTNGTSDFTGGVSIADGILEFTSVADGGSASSLGAGTSLSGTSTAITGQGATYRYIGSSASSTNRSLSSSSSTTGAIMTFDASGSSPTATISYTNTSNFTFGANPKTVVLTGGNAGSNTMTPNFTGSSAIVKNGVGKWVLSGANTNNGPANSLGAGVSVNAGTLVGNQTSGSAFGTVGVVIGAGTLALAPTGSGANINIAGGSATVANTFSFNADAQFSLDKGSNSSLTYTYTRSTATQAFTRGTNGTLILSVGAIGNLGNTVANGGERFLVATGTVPLTNNLVSGVVAQDRGNSNAGDFVTFGATNGFTAATPDINNTFTGTSNAKYVNVSNAGLSTGGAVAAYALKVNGQSLVNTSILTLGGSTAGVGSVVLNGGTITGGTITTPTSVATELLVYTSGTSAISSSINTATSQAGLSLFGPGTLNVSGSSGNSFTGGLRVNNSTLIASNDNQLGGTVSAITLTGGTLQTSGTFALGGGNRAITLNVGQDKTGATFNVASGTTTFTNNSTGTKVLSGAGSLTKTGLGTLVLDGNTANTYTGSTLVSAGTLLVNTALGSGTGTGALRVAANATLGGTGGIIGGPVSIVGTDASNKATLAPGASVGTLNVAGTTTFGDYSLLSIELGSDSVDLLAGAGMDLSSTNDYVTISATGTQSQSRYVFATYSGTLSSNVFDNVTITGLGAAAAIDYSVPGQIAVVIPEPATGLAIGLVGLAGISRRRRRD